MSSKTRTAVGFVMTVIALMLVTFIVGPMPIVRADPAQESDAWRARVKNHNTIYQNVWETISPQLLALSTEELESMLDKQDKATARWRVVRDALSEKLANISTLELLKQFPSRSEQGQILIANMLGMRKDCTLAQVITLDDSVTKKQKPTVAYLLLTKLKSEDLKTLLTHAGRFGPGSGKEIEYKLELIARDDYPAREAFAMAEDILRMKGHKEWESQFSFAARYAAEKRVDDVPSAALLKMFPVLDQLKWFVLNKLVARTDVPTETIIDLMEKNEWSSYHENPFRSPGFLKALSSRTDLTIEQGLKVIEWTNAAQ